MAGMAGDGVPSYVILPSSSVLQKDGPACRTLEGSVESTLPVRWLLTSLRLLNGLASLQGA